MDLDDPTRASTGEVARTTTLIASTVLCLAALLVLAWLSSTALLIIFAGILLAVALDGGARALGRVVGSSHRVRLGLAILILAVVLGGALAWGGAALVMQFDELAARVGEQLARLQGPPPSPGSPPTPGGRGGLTGLLPDFRSLFGGATNAIFSLFGAVGNFVVILFLGIFLAADPGTYKSGLLSLLSKDRRPRISEVLDGAAAAMRGWLVGQTISMAVIFIVTYAALALIGMPYPLLLALQSGLLVFIPTLGPAISGVIIVLAGLADGPSMALWGLGVYVLIQFLETNILTPYVQKRAVDLPPAFTLGVQLVMGALFGILGIALAVPFAAACKTMIEELYVKDALGGPWRGGEARD